MLGDGIHVHDVRMVSAGPVEVCLSVSDKSLFALWALEDWDLE